MEEEERWRRERDGGDGGGGVVVEEGSRWWRRDSGGGVEEGRRWRSGWLDKNSSRLTPCGAPDATSSGLSAAATTTVRRC